MEMVGAREVVTTMVMALLVAVALLAQAALLVKITRTTALFVSAVVVKLLELVPTLTPFTCHW